ncbi:MAG: hypothetical protein FWB74_00510 [Defluviitaleaceae bacterium]|nr:hypothetical protein [Defluviitaleaceae bacterium]
MKKKILLAITIAVTAFMLAGCGRDVWTYVGGDGEGYLLFRSSWHSGNRIKIFEIEAGEWVEIEGITDKGEITVLITHAETGELVFALQDFQAGAISFRARCGGQHMIEVVTNNHSGSVSLSW